MLVVVLAARRPLPGCTPLLSSPLPVPDVDDRPPATMQNTYSQDENEQTTFMSAAHAYSLEQDVCVICDGECTCEISESTAPAPYIPPTPAPTPAAPLKIKLTVPPGLFTRPVPSASSSAVIPQKKTKSTISPYAAKAPHPPPRKRGRPPKALAAAYAAQAAKKSSQVATIKKTSPSVIASKGKGKAPAAKKAVVASGNAVKGGRNARRRMQIASDDDYNPLRAGPSSLKRTHSTIDYSDDDEEDIPLRHKHATKAYPPFLPVPSHALSSASSSGSSSSSSDSDDLSDDLSDFSDSSLAHEEESYIKDDETHRRAAHEKARVTRELFGENPYARKSHSHSQWDIRPRQRSVSAAPEDNMDVDEDADGEDESEGEEDEEEADGEAEADADAEDDAEEGEVESELRGPAYVGIGTGWTDDDDEDAFDAALFFSALDADSDDASPAPKTALLVHPDAQMDEDATEDDDEMSWDEDAEFAQGVFEVTHAWDGSVAFTNGFRDGQGLLDWAFEAEAAAAISSDSPSSSPTPEPMPPPSSALTLDFLSSGAGLLPAFETAAEEDGEQGDDEEMEDEMDSDAGSSTDDELVDAHGLPTERLMRLFRPPAALPVSIDPQSTLSPTRASADLDLDSDKDEPPTPPRRAMSTGRKSKSRGPPMGTFSTVRSDSLRRAVIDGARSPGKEAASPFPLRRRRGFSESNASSIFSGTRGRSASLSQFSQTLLSPSPALGSDFPRSPSPFNRNPLTPGSSLALSTPLPLSADIFPVAPSPIEPPSEPARLELSDVLDASLLAGGEDEGEGPAPPDTELSDALATPSTFARWERVPIGTFRRASARESGLLSDSGMAYAGNGAFGVGGMVRGSPFSTLTAAPALPEDSPTPVSRRAVRRRLSVAASPVLLPTIGTTSTETTPKRKESRQDKIARRRSAMHLGNGSVPNGGGHRGKGKVHRRGHHPNDKARGGLQRNGGVPPLSI
ncbi:unnamed protein product [Peniophora sp. CBMAI 1063]|nr:unnamed protein product [Peniophora sp. CBMAI 1063]